jgi:hypothetical protein
LRGPPDKFAAEASAAGEEMRLAGSLGRWLIGEELPSSRSIAAITNELFGLADHVGPRLAVIEDRLGDARDPSSWAG